MRFIFFFLAMTSSQVFFASSNTAPIFQPQTSLMKGTTEKTKIEKMTILPSTRIQADMEIPYTKNVNLGFSLQMTSGISSTPNPIQDPEMEGPRTLKTPNVAMKLGIFFRGMFPFSYPIPGDLFARIDGGFGPFLNYGGGFSARVELSLGGEFYFLPWLALVVSYGLFGEIGKDLFISNIDTGSDDIDLKIEKYTYSGKVLMIGLKSTYF